MRLKAIIEKRIIWTIGLYELENAGEIFSLAEHRPVHLFGQRGLRLNAGYQAVCADPFLFAHGARLYLFYEVMTDFGHGEIYAISMDERGTWADHGSILSEEFHVSYPQVFSYKNKIWMVPETASDGKVWLYVADDFPYKWRRLKVLIDEPLADPSLIILRDGIFLLGTTRKNELKIYLSVELQDAFIPADAVITSDNFCSRNAGSPLFINGYWYRCAQDCRTAYGQSVSLWKIENLSVANYAERLALAEVFPSKLKWMRQGHHHISAAHFNNKYYVAVDGMRKDKYVNTLLLAVFKARGRHEQVE